MIININTSQQRDRDRCVMKKAFEGMNDKKLS